MQPLITPGRTFRQFRVDPPPDLNPASRIAYRKYDLYNQTYNNGSAMAWELKVGYQSGDTGSTNWNQISFDETMLLHDSVGYLHQGDDGGPVVPEISRILWWEQPRAGGSSGLSADLAQRLRNAVNATNGAFAVEVDFPDDQNNSGSGQSPPSGGNQPIGIPVPIPIPEPVPVLAGASSGSSCGTLT